MLKKPNYNIKNKTVKQIVFDAQNDIIRASQNELTQVGHKLVRYAQNEGLGLSQNKIGKVVFRESYSCADAVGILCEICTRLSRDYL